MPENLDERILKCLDRALDTLGQSVKQTTYFYLAKEEGVVPRDLINNTRKFLDALHNFFSDGADVIEHLIIRELRKEADLSIIESGNLPDAIRSTRARLEGRSVL